MKIRLLLSLFLIVPSTHAFDPAALAQLTEQVRLMNEQIQIAQDTIDVQKNLQKLQQASGVATVSEFGRNLGQLTNEIRTTQSLIEDYESPGEQIDQLWDDMQYYADGYDNAANQDDRLVMLEKYARAMKRLENQYWTGTPQEDEANKINSTENMNDLEALVTQFKMLSILEEANQKEREKIATSGLNNDEAIRSSATNMNVLVDLMLQDANDKNKEEFAKFHVEREQEAAMNQLFYIPVEEGF